LEEEEEAVRREREREREKFIDNGEKGLFKAQAMNEVDAGQKITQKRMPFTNWGRGVY
jgi:hypothetical protein